jgi:hypothetical protein
VVAYNRVVLRGSLSAGAEEWSTGCAYVTAQGGTLDSQSELQDWATSIASGLDAILAGPIQNVMGAAANITDITTQAYNSLGELIAQAGVVGLDFSGVGGQTKVNQTSIVFSLRTLRPGVTGRGRMYWPALAATLTSTGLLATPSNSSLATHAAQVLEFIGTAVPLAEDMVPVVVSQTADVFTLVNRVLVGNVLDTQRRRRNRLPEQYAASPFPPA